MYEFFAPLWPFFLDSSYLGVPLLVIAVPLITWFTIGVLNGGKSSCLVSFLSEMTFWWMNPLINLGYKKTLTQEDLYHLPYEHQASVVSDKFQRCDNNLKSSSIIESLFRSHIWEISFVCFLRLFDNGVTFVSPILLDYFLIWMETRKILWVGIFFAIAMFLSSILETLVGSLSGYKKSLISMNMETILTDAIYKKSLKLSPQSKVEYPTGTVLNLASGDAERLTMFITVIDNILGIPFQIVVAIYLLWQKLGVAAIFGVISILIFIPIDNWLNSKWKKIWVSTLDIRDKRSKLMMELLSGIKVIKLFGWEESFSNQIKDYRLQELKSSKSQMVISSVNRFVSTLAPLIVASISLISFIILNGNLDASIAFVSLSLFSILRNALEDIPWLIKLITKVGVAKKRLTGFLDCEEFDNDLPISSDNKSTDAIVLKSGNFSWTKKDSSNLEDIDICIPKNKIVAIVGEVGSGKSSLVSAILGEMNKISGDVSVSGSVGYVSQQAWIQNATLKENIIFTSDYNQYKFDEIIKVTALEEDIKILPAGIDTEIGEKGINLSGGQKQRVAIARAIYADPDIYLLDDPLSAVDSHVGKNIFDQVISSSSGLLKDKTRILVTHNISLLPRVDKIIVMKDGKVTESGTFDELLDKKESFAEFLMEFLDNKDTDADSDTDHSVIEGVKSKLAPQIERRLSQNSNKTFERQKSKTLSRQSSKKDANIDPKTPKKLAFDGKLMRKEIELRGSVSSSVYKDYLRAIRSTGKNFVFALIPIYCALTLSSSYYLYEWASDKSDEDASHRNLRVGLYGIIQGSTYALFFGFHFVFSLLAMDASQLIYTSMLDKVIRSPISFFDTTQVGQIMNRFTKDIDTVDSGLLLTLIESFNIVLNAIINLSVISVQSSYLLIAIFPLGFIYCMIQKYQQRTSRQLRRIQANTISPIYSHFTESFNGSSTIRAFGVQEIFQKNCHSKIDQHSQAHILFIGARYWLNIRLSLISDLIVLIGVLLAVTGPSVDAAIAGLIISYTQKIPRTLRRLIRSIAGLENDFITAERCFEYTRLKSEADWYNQDSHLDNEWPNLGVISFQNYSTRYRDNLDLILKDITFETKPGEKVGIVGRTGVGKSSLTLSLLRLIEPVEGKILIDGVDISTIGLMDLRKRLTIIPQDPFLFAGTLRKNLDPLGVHSDGEIIQSLELSHLKNYFISISSEEGDKKSLKSGLDYKITDGGDNLSVGQRQLVCLARALLRKSKILILDEATAAVDLETDALIQSTVREQFGDCTILTIAHRLNTILDYDRILALDQGRVIEFDSRSKLLEDESSMFYSLARDAKIV